jgi:hypothetical protein
MNAFHRSRLVAGIALFATLFSAVSPAIAGVLFSDRADILGRLLAIPAASTKVSALDVTLQGDVCHEAAPVAGNHDALGHEPHDDSEHAAHGVYCSFCLTAGSTLAIDAPDGAAVLPAGPGPVLQSAREQVHPRAPFVLSRAPRGPPVLPA